MGAKINKALDYNKLKENHAKGKLLKKNLKFPMMAQIKWDGNYTVTEVINGKVTHYTSGGLTYTSEDNASDIFNDVENGYYIAERCGAEGKLGQRVRCNLKGSKDDQKSKFHHYKVFDYLTEEEYKKGKSTFDYETRLNILTKLSGMDPAHIIEYRMVYSDEQLDSYLEDVVSAGYEGLMLVSPDFIWEDTTSRKPHLCKYKKRPTVDLLCTGTLSGTGKYSHMIGSLILEDSKGRKVKVGSGLADHDRARQPDYFIGEVIEIEYEQIIDTYIQPTFIRVREDKFHQEID